MLADTTMPSSTKWLIDALGPFAHESVTVVHLLSCKVLLKGLSSLTAGIDPTVWVPLCVILPNFPIDLSEGRRGYGRVTLWNDVLTVLRRGRQGARDNNIRDDTTLYLGKICGKIVAKDGVPLSCEWENGDAKFHV